MKSSDLQLSACWPPSIHRSFPSVLQNADELGTSFIPHRWTSLSPVCSAIISTNPGSHFLAQIIQVWTKQTVMLLYNRDVTSWAAAGIRRQRRRQRTFAASWHRQKTNTVIKNYNDDADGIPTMHFMIVSDWIKMKIFIQCPNFLSYGKKKKELFSFFGSRANKNTQRGQ